MGLNDDAAGLLNQLEVLRHPSDLDLLVFFARHPRALLASDHLVKFLGYGAKEIASSLDLLLQAGFLARTPNPKHAARLYVFAPSPPAGDGLFSLLELASTRDGRLALISALMVRSSATTNGSTQERASEKHGALTTLPFLKGRTPPMDTGRRPHVDDAKAASSEEWKHGGPGGRR